MISKYYEYPSLRSRKLKYHDPETGLHYNYFRYYDPGTGRYMRPDPIGQTGGINLYRYVGNNPLNFYDFFGLWWELKMSLENPSDFEDYVWGREYGNFEPFSLPHPSEEIFWVTDIVCRTMAEEIAEHHLGKACAWGLRRTNLLLSICEPNPRDAHAPGRTPNEHQNSKYKQ